MANNKLRREIVEWASSCYGSPDEKVLTGYRLLQRALIALGGPVGDARPEKPHTPTEAEKIDLGRPVSPGDGFIDACGKQQEAIDLQTMETKVLAAIDVLDEFLSTCPVEGTVGCPPVDAVSTPEGGTDCNRYALVDAAIAAGFPVSAEIDRAYEARQAGRRVMEDRPALMRRLADHTYEDMELKPGEEPRLPTVTFGALNDDPNDDGA